MTVEVPKNVILNNAVFFIDVDKILPNPYQPRREFDEEALKELAESIRQYGLLQPVTVSRLEQEKADGGFVTMYELIAGERRLRASKLAGLKQIPAIIRVGDDNNTRAELALIENLQREDLNPIDRAFALDRLQKEFAMKHEEIGKKMGKSRVFVTNSIRLLQLPREIQLALGAGKISEGHTRPLLMLTDKPEEQMTLFREMMIRKMTVREAESLGRKVAQDRVRKQQYIKDPNILEIENSLGEKLGTRVHVEKRDVGGVIKIDFFSYDDLEMIANQIEKANISETQKDKLSKKLQKAMGSLVGGTPEVKEIVEVSEKSLEETNDAIAGLESTEISDRLIDDRGKDEIQKDVSTEDDDLYNIKNFTI
jgi:ParB family chromosome partitioning protein